MTQEELKAKLDEWLGMTSAAEVFRPDTATKLRYTSPTGIVLFEITIAQYSDEDGWQFAGYSQVFPCQGIWEMLCHFHKTA